MLDQLKTQIIRGTQFNWPLEVVSPDGDTWGVIDLRAQLRSTPSSPIMFEWATGARSESVEAENFAVLEVYETALGTLNFTLTAEGAQTINWHPGNYWVDFRLYRASPAFGPFIPCQLQLNVLPHVTEAP